MIGIKKLMKSFVYAFKGLRSVFLKEQNMKIHVLVALGVIVAGAVIGLSNLEWVAIVVCIALVMAAETINTAIEELVNLVSPEWNPLAGRVKDLAAGAVVICAVSSVIVGGCIFIPKLF